MKQQQFILLRSSLLPQLRELQKQHRESEPKHITLDLSFTAFQQLLAHLSGAETSAHFVRHTSLSEDVQTRLIALRKDIETIKAEVRSTFSKCFEDASRTLGVVLNELYAGKGAHLCTLIQLENSLSLVREQLTKIAKLIENSIDAYDSRPQNSKNSKNSKHPKAANSKTSASSVPDPSAARVHSSKLIVLLSPIQQIVDNILQRLTNVEKEVRETELAKGVTFSVILKQKQDLTAREQKLRDALLANPVINSRIALCVKSASAMPSSPLTPTGRNVPSGLNDRQRPPSSVSSCSVTELEDFMYNLLHGCKEGPPRDNGVFNQDVSLEDLLALSRASASVASPIATTTGCFRDIEAVSAKPEGKFDPKKVKRIEFSDDKLREQLGANGNPGPGPSAETIDKLALNTILRNQPPDKVLCYKDYIKMCKKDRVKKSRFSEMLGSDVVSSQSFLSSFDVPEETPDSFGSLRTRNLGKGSGAPQPSSNCKDCKDPQKPSPSQGSSGQLGQQPERQHDNKRQHQHDSQHKQKRSEKSKHKHPHQHQHQYNQNAEQPAEPRHMHSPHEGQEMAKARNIHAVQGKNNKRPVVWDGVQKFDHLKRMVSSKGSSLPGVTSLSTLRQLENQEVPGRPSEPEGSNRPQELRSQDHDHGQASNKKHGNRDVLRNRLQLELGLSGEDPPAYEGSHGGSRGPEQPPDVRLKSRQQRPGSQKRRWDPYCDNGARGVKRNESFAVLQCGDALYPSAYQSKERDNLLKRSKSIVALQGKSEVPPENVDDCRRGQPKRTIEKTKSVRSFPKRGSDKSAAPHSGQRSAAANRSVIERNLRLPSLSDEKKLPQSKRPRVPYPPACDSAPLSSLSSTISFND